MSNTTKALFTRQVRTSHYDKALKAYVYKTRDVDFEIEIDFAAACTELQVRAVQNSSKVSKDCGGAVILRVLSERIIEEKQVQS